MIFFESTSFQLVCYNGFMKNTIKKISLLLVFVLTFSLFPKTIFGFSEFDVEPYYQTAIQAKGESAYFYNQKLASEEFEGRQAGAKGSQIAADWIAKEFQQMGLKPFDQKSGSYFQALTVPYHDVLKPLIFAIKEDTSLINPSYRKDFIVFPYSGSGKVNSKLVFVGYGITEESSQYDDYQNIDVTNRVVVMFYQKPSFLSEQNDEFGSLERIKNAKKHKASAVIFIQKSNGIPLFEFDMKMATGRKADLPALYATNELSEKIVSLQNKTIEDLEEQIDKKQEPESFVIDHDIQLEVNVVDEPRTSNNVIGFIPSIDPFATESIVIGGHYDHLGLDYINSTMYAGANDNASGTACMMEIAKNLTRSGCMPLVNLVFIAFTGEEEGLYGSEYYVEHPLFPIKNIRAMINLDMVGTGTGDLLAGTSSVRYPELSDLIETCAEYLEQTIPIDSSLLYPGSDHYFFHVQKVPSVFFFKLNPTNIGGYHTLEDTIETIDPINLENCSQMVCLMVLTLSESSLLDLSNFPFDEKFIDPYFVWESKTTNFINNDLNLFLNDKPIKIMHDDTFQAFYPLQQGSNEIIITVKLKDSLVFRVSYILQSNAEPWLRADFNQDKRVDVSDLILLARNFQRKAPLYQSLSLFDINGDEIINLEDYNQFLKYFEIANSQKQ